MKKIVIASKNPVKLEATMTGFQNMFPETEFEIVGVSVTSGVSDQPLTNTETFTGANNRSLNASSEVPDADFYVGIEGGVEDSELGMESFAWVVIKDQDGYTGKGRSSAFYLPPAVSDLIKDGKELGEADDIVFNQTNSKQNTGAVGILTKDVVTRTKYYTEAVILALIPFKNPELYRN